MGGLMISIIDSRQELLTHPVLMIRAAVHFFRNDESSVDVSAAVM
jgi:hypothetical protein